MQRQPAIVEAHRRRDLVGHDGAMLADEVLAPADIDIMRVPAFRLPGLGADQHQIFDEQFLNHDLLAGVGLVEQRRIQKSLRQAFQNAG